MSQMRVVEKADRSPSCCAACGGNNAPFVDLQLISFRINTPVGVQEIEGTIYLCVGTVENPGCAVHIGRNSGQLVDTAKLDEMREQSSLLNQEIAELRSALSKKTLKVADVVAAFPGLVQTGENTFYLVGE